MVKVKPRWSLPWSPALMRVRSLHYYQTQMVDRLKRGIYLIGDNNEAGELKHKLACGIMLLFFCKYIFKFNLH